MIRTGRQGREGRSRVPSLSLPLAALGMLLASRPGQQTSVAQAASPQADLTVLRVSLEPDADEREHSLRWSPDGERVAWLQLLRPDPKAHNKTLQREVWSFPQDAPRIHTAIDSFPSTGANPPAATVPPPVLLVSAAKVTECLSGSAAPGHRTLDEDADENPWLLTDFAWSPDHGSLLLIGPQSLAWFDLASGKSRQLIAGTEPISDVALSPDGRTVSFLRAHSLWLVAVGGGHPRVFAQSPHTGVLEGELDWPYRNELHLSRAYAWSPDSKSIAWLQIDDRRVSKYALGSSDGHNREIVYPAPHGEIPAVQLFVKRAVGGAPFAVRLDSRNAYLPRFSWLPDSRRIAVERLARSQHTLELFIADPATGSSRLVLSEQDPYWINLSDDLRFLSDGKRFLWSSERTGFRHLYLYDTAGRQLAQLTHGNWEATRLNAIDEANQTIYFTATEKSPLERHLYRIRLDGGEPSRLTQQTGTHEIYFSPNASRLIDCFSTHADPPVLSLVATLDLESANPPLPIARTASISVPPLQPQEFLPFKLHLGAETGAFLIKPPGFDPKKKYPVIVYLASGPGEQLVRDVWAGATGLWMQLMAQKGYIVFALDNQGTAGRGHYFEEPIHLRLGAQELIDQRDGLLYLNQLPYIDTTRLGVCGWGYGGFLAVHAMLDRPVPFKAGFAGAPVVDWHLYDAVFAERYLEDPVAHADGWQASSALENDSPRFFKSKLMVAQGTLDEFTHMENLLTLQDRLLDQGKSAQTLLFADRGHKIEDPPSRLFLFEQMTDFFLKNL